MTDEPSVDASRDCALCGLPLPARPWRLHSAGRGYLFCCEGCLGIFRMLHEVQETTVADPASASTIGPDGSPTG